MNYSLYYCRVMELRTQHLSTVLTLCIGIHLVYKGGVQGASFQEAQGGGVKDMNCTIKDTDRHQPDGDVSVTIKYDETLYSNGSYKCYRNRPTGRKWSIIPVKVLYVGGPGWTTVSNSSASVDMVCHQRGLLSDSSWTIYNVYLSDNTTSGGSLGIFYCKQGGLDLVVAAVIISVSAVMGGICIVTCLLCVLKCFRNKDKDNKDESSSSIETYPSGEISLRNRVGPHLARPKSLDIHYDQELKTFVINYPEPESDFAVMPTRRARSMESLAVHAVRQPKMYKYND